MGRLLIFLTMQTSLKILIASLLIGGLGSCNKPLEMLRLADLDGNKVRVKEKSDRASAVFIFLSTHVSAQTDFAPGEIMFTGYDSDAPNAFSIVFA